MNERTREAIRYSLTVFVVVRVGLFVLGLAAVEVVQPVEPVGVPGWPAGALPDPGLHNVFTAWERHDALWYLRIAESGYSPGDGSAAFFPLFPMSIRAVSWTLGGHPFAAAMLVSNLAFAAALCVLYLLTAEERSVDTARTTVLLVAAGPASLFFYAPYTEPLFLLFALVALRGARRGSWVVAGGAAALAALTRSIGLVVPAAIAVEAVQQRLEGRRRGSLVRGLSAAAAGAAGAATYLLYWQLKGDDWLAPLRQQATWQRRFQPPWETLFDATARAVRYLGEPNGGYWLIDWLLVVPVVAAAVYVVFRYRPAYAVFVIAGLLIPLSYVFEPRPLMSMPRFVLPLFPAFWAIAEAAGRLEIPREALVGVSAAMLGALTVLFVNWYYIF